MEATSAAAQATGALCEVCGVSQEFTLPNGKLLKVLKDVTLAIRPHEIVALLGPSGCGKSTIVRLLAGLIPPTRGEVLYHGQPLRGLSPGAAIVFQSFALYPWFTVARNVEVVLEAAAFPTAEVRARTERVVRMIGLAGFEEAYPRELSGGMKQRVGMARALAVGPEILFMDEPFSQVDALTAESLRAEVVDLWGAGHGKPSSIVMVSHDIKEVVYMADRIVILSANPGRILTVVDNRLPRPRDYRLPEFLALVDRLHDIITGAELPDAPAAAPPGPPSIEPLPAARASEVVGLLEYLDARGGKEDIFRIAAETRRRFDEVVNVAEAAEMLDFVDTPKRLVVLDAVGKRFLQANQEGRKAIWREQLLKLRLFHDVYEALRREPRHAVEDAFIKESIVIHLPQENYEKVFQTFIRWARFGNLFAYDEATGTVSLQ